MTRMFPFLTCQPNLIGGCASCNYWTDEDFRLCSFSCVYCWASDLKTRFKYPKYQGPWRWYESALPQCNEDDFPWPCDMIDIGDPTLPISLLMRLFDWIRKQPCKVLTLTKNPLVYLYNRNIIPENAVLGATIETDTTIFSTISRAPHPNLRFDAMEWLSNNLPNDLFLCAEPVMKFSPNFVKKIIEVRPWAFAIGHDNYNNNLPEPTLSEDRELISELEPYMKVYIKTLPKSLQGKKT